MNSFFTNIHTMEEKTAISFANVAASYDDKTEVLSDVSFNIGGGNFYFLSGASGAGKTTLLPQIISRTISANFTHKTMLGLFVQIAHRAARLPATQI